MDSTNNKHTLDEPTSINEANAVLAMLERDSGRLKVRGIIDDYVNTESFRNKIIDVVRDTLGHTDTYAVLKPQIATQTESILAEKGLKQKRFWIPVAISIISLLITIGGFIIAIIK